MIKVTAIFISLILGSGLFLYESSRVDLLLDHYVIFNSSQGSYELVEDKPPHWIGVVDVSKDALWAILVSEDWAFYNHSGFDLAQIKVVFFDSLESGKITRGASTITQQVVKNAILTNEKSLNRKVQEFIGAIKLESILSKNKILEQYLNLVELGDNLYGIKKASYYYFQKSPIELTAREGAFLASLLPSPKKYSESFTSRKLTKFMTLNIKKILLKLRQAHILSEDQRINATRQLFTWE